MPLILCVVTQSSCMALRYYRANNFVAWSGDLRQADVTYKGQMYPPHATEKTPTASVCFD